MKRYKSAIALWSLFMKLGGIAWCCGSKRRQKSRSSARKSASARPVKTARPRSHQYWLIYRLPHGQFPEPGVDLPVGGLVMPIQDAPYMEQIAAERYHTAPWERLWREDVSDSREERRQARELQWVWELEMDAWLETAHG